ncbi:GumC family protein [Stappia sp.]|uniref:GumC family protein n=1 Tax=Stappia sp. TaxID=1870903 RepID=UPI003C7A99C0
MIDIYQIPGILRKRIGWLFVLPAVMTTLALGFLALKTPQYSASAELLIEPRGLQIVGNDILARDNGDALQRLAVDSQTYVILSQAVLEDVVERLDLTDDPAITKLPGGGLLSRLLGRGAPTPTEEDIRAAAIAGLKDRLQAVRVEKAFVINIIMRHPDRFAAAAIANEAARAYLDEARRSRADATLRASVALQEQAADLKTRVEAAEAAVETFRAENGLISTGQRGLVVDQQLQDINTQLTQARVDLERAKSNADLLKTLTVTDIEAGGLPANLQTTTLGSLRVQFARIAEREAQAATTLGANHPQLRELRSQLDNTRRLIADELSRVRRSVDSDLQRALANVTALKGEADRLASTNVDQSRSQIRLRQLENEASSLGAVYNSFLSRANELQEQQEIDTSNSRIISRAVAPLKSNGPSGLIVLAAAAVFGFALAAAGSVGWEMINGKLGSDRELVERTGVPLIARLSAPGSGKGTARLARFMPGESSATRTSERQLAVARVAYALRHAFAEERPANILVVSAGEEAALSPLVRAIASGLYDMGEEVLLARTDANAALSAPRREMLTTREPKRTRLSSRRRAGPALQEDGFAPAALRAGAAASPFTVERLDGHAHVPGDDQIGAGEDEFLLIDGGSALSNPYLPVLLGQSDAILLVTHLGQTSRQDLDRTLTLLQPWQDRMIGNVALAA